MKYLSTNPRATAAAAIAISGALAGIDPRYWLAIGMAAYGILHWLQPKLLFLRLFCVWILGCLGVIAVGFEALVVPGLVEIRFDSIDLGWEFFLFAIVIAKMLLGAHRRS